MSELENSILFDAYRRLDCPAEDILSQLDATGIDKKTLRNVLYNLYVANKIEQSWSRPAYVAVSLNGSDYANTSRYGLLHFKRDSVKASLQYLETNGLIDIYDGFKNRGTGFGRCTRIRATTKLATWFAANEKKLNVSAFPLLTSVIVKDESGRLARAPNIEKCKRLDARLRRINQSNAKHDIKIHSEHVAHEIARLVSIKPNSADESICFNFINTSTGITNKERTNKHRKYSILLEILATKSRIDDYCHMRSLNNLKRIFNYSSLTLGGRFYGSAVQRLSKQGVRRHLLIDGEPATECDFSAIHGRMLYARLGVDYRDDPYVIPGVDREGAKLLYLICINARSRMQAIGAVRERQDCGKLRSQLAPSALVGLFEKKHSSIMPFCYTEHGAGIALQYKDSQIAEEILLEFAAMGEACIPIHDSFIVKSSQRQLLIDAMRRAYMKHVGYEPIIKNEY